MTKNATPEDVIKAVSTHNGVNLKKTGWHFLSIRNLTTVDLKNLWRIEIYY